MLQTPATSLPPSLSLSTKPGLVKFFNTMHAIRGGWVGQTFALPKCNDSGGKKSRIRRSKEERKTMVESFIKKYQTLNNGNFPSLNLTHKEVGGSFYTVREIVREIIQENRVLGPAKFPSEEQDADIFSEQYPLGSISMEPESYLVSSNETHIIQPSLPNHHRETKEAQVFESNGHSQEPAHLRLDDGIIDNGSIHTTELKQESQESVNSEPSGMKGIEGDENVEKELVKSEAKIPLIPDDVMVETFPLRPLTDKIYALEVDSGKSRVFAGTLEEERIENMGLEAVNDSPVLDTMDVPEISSTLVDDKAEIDAESPSSESSSVFMNVKTDPSLESLNDSKPESSNLLEVNDETTGLETKEILTAEINHMRTPSSIENLNGTISSSSQGQGHQSISKEVDELKKESGIRHGGRPQRASDPTLDRINLKSWEATTDRSSGPETMSAMGLIKAFITAFVKFWTE